MSGKLQNYCLFKRMIAVRPAVYNNHKQMLKLYEAYCNNASLPTYWGNDDGDSGDDLSVAPAEETNEGDCVDGFWQAMLPGNVTR